MCPVTGSPMSAPGPVCPDSCWRWRVRTWPFCPSTATARWLASSAKPSGSLGLGERCRVEQARVEAVDGGGGFDTVTSRAFASLPDFVAASRHLLAPGGRWLALKGRRPDDEIAALPDGVRVEAVLPLHVPDLAEQRHAIIMAGPSTETAA
jgi:hypothetical protein